MLYSDQYLNKYIQIIDNVAGNVLASGKVITCKTNAQNCGISFDEKYFFRETNNLSYKEVDFANTFVPESFPEYIIVDYWRNFKENNNVDIYRDFCYDEIDVEIKEYITVLNTLDSTIRTTSSCCGHGSGFWYIEFCFLDFTTLSKFINVVESFDGDIYLGTNLRTGTLTHTDIDLQLKPEKCDKEYKLLSKFVKRVKNYFTCSK